MARPSSFVANCSSHLPSSTASWCCQSKSSAASQGCKLGFFRFSSTLAATPPLQHLHPCSPPPSLQYPHPCSTPTLAAPLPLQHPHPCRHPHPCTPSPPPAAPPPLHLCSNQQGHKVPAQKENLIYTHIVQLPFHGFCIVVNAVYVCVLQHIYMIDSKGLVTTSRGDELPPHKKIYARTDGTPDMKDLTEIVKYAKPHAIVGLTGGGEAWGKVPSQPPPPPIASLSPHPQPPASTPLLATF